MRRTIVVCDHAEVGDGLRTQLESTGHVVEVLAPADVLPHQLDDAHCVVALDDTNAVTELLARLRGNTRVAIVLPTMSLPAAIEWLSASPRVVAVSASDVDANELASTLDGDRITLDEMLAPSTVMNHVITDDLGRRTYLGQLAQHVAKVGVPTQLQHAIEQACDELVTNALYAAPVDAEGKPLFGELSTTERLRYRTDANVTARFGGNEHVFAVSVRDEYGSLQRVTALAYMHKGIHATSKVDQRVSGAGLGLYLIATECAAMHIFIEHGVATEIVCIFDVRAERQQLRRLSMVSVDGDAEEIAARARSRPSVLRRTRGGGPTRTWLLGGALATIAAGIAGVVAWRMRSSEETFSLAITTEPPGATVTVDGRVVPGSAVALRSSAPIVITAELAGYVGRRFVVTPRPGTPLVVTLVPQSATLDIDSIPPGATVLLDKKSVGATPLVLTDLPPGREVALTLERQGFAPTTVRAVVPAAGKRAEVREQLAPAPGYSLVHIDSSPPGARVIEPSLGTSPVFTPADVVVSTAEPHQFSLVMPRHLPASLPVSAADGASPTVVLEAVPVIQIDSDRAATATVIDVAHCAKLELPAECPVRAGTYEVEIRSAGQPVVRRTAMVGDQDIVIRY